MPNINIEFNTDNAAFEDSDQELDYVLNQVKKIINSGNFDIPLRDSNGNKIGKVSIS
jgi:uncharacterized lipoprotein